MMLNLVETLLGRSTPIPTGSWNDPNSWVLDVMGGGSQSTAGVRVSRKTALGLASIWRAINLNSRDVAKTPLEIFRRTENDGRTRAIEHPVFPILRRKFAPNITAFVAKQAMQAHVKLQGNAYAYIRRRGDGYAKELWPLSPESTYIIRVDGKLWYMTRVNDEGEERRLSPRNVLHIKGLTYEGLTGYVVLEFARNSVGHALAMREYGARFYKNDARPGIVLEHPKLLSEQAQKHLLNSYLRSREGLDKAHGAYVAEEGMKVKVLSNNAREAQFTEGLDFGVREIANVIGTQPHKLGDPTRTAYASLEEENQSNRDELDADFVSWEEECYDKLLTTAEKENDTHYCEFNRSALVRANMKARHESYSLAIMAGWMAPNEARKKENMNAKPGLDGTLRPLNMTVVNADGSSVKTEFAPADDSEPKDDDAAASRFTFPTEALESHRKLVMDAVARIGKRIGLQVCRAAKKPDSFLDWVDERLHADHGPVFRAALAPIVAAIRSLSEDSVGCGEGELAETYFAGLHEELLTASECQPDELPERVKTWARGLQDVWPGLLADKLIRKTAIFEVATN